MVIPSVRDEPKVAIAPTPDPVLAMDGHMRLVHFNAAAEDMLGYQREELMGRPLTALLPEGLGMISLAKLQEAVARGKEGAIESHRTLNLRHHKGYPLPVEASLALVRHPDHGYAVIATMKELSVQQQQKLEAEVLASLSSLLAGEVSWQRLGQRMHTELERLMPVKWLTLCLYKSKDKRARVLTWSGYEGLGRLEAGQELAFSRELSEGLDSDETVILDLTAPSAGLERRLCREGVKQLMLAPLTHRGRTLGLLCLGAKRKGALTPSHQFLLEQLKPQMVAALERELTKGRAESYRRRYNELLERMDEPLFRADLEGNLEYANPALLKLLACKDLKELAHTVEPLFVDSKRTRKQILKRLTISGWLSNEKLALIDRLGREAPVNLSAHLVYDELGEPAAVEGSLRDLREQEALRSALKDSQARFDKLLESSPDSMLLANDEGWIIEANPAAERMLGYSRAELVGRHIKEILALSRRNLEQLREGHSISKPVAGYNRAGEPVGAWKATERLQRGEESFICAFGREEMRGAETQSPALPYPEPPGPEPAPLPEEGPTPQNLAEPDTDKEPEVRERMLGYARMLEAQVGQYQQEQTHQVHQAEGKEEMLALMEAKAEEIGQALDPLLKVEQLSIEQVPAYRSSLESLARGLEELLTALAGQSGLEAAAGDLAELQGRVSQRLAELAELGEVDTAPGCGEEPQGWEADLGVLELAPVDLNRAVEATLTLLEEQLRAKATVVFKAGKLPLVEAHLEQLEQVLQNLLLNASEAIETVEAMGTITVTTNVAGGWAEIAIADDGVGLTQKELKMICEPFYTTKSRGQGLGLAICRKVAAAHNGQIHISSKKGAGSTFTLRLPLRDGSKVELTKE